MVTCSNCQTTVQSTERIYCPSCGAELPEGADQSKLERTETESQLNTSGVSDESLSVPNDQNNFSSPSRKADQPATQQSPDNIPASGDQQPRSNEPDQQVKNHKRTNQPNSTAGTENQPHDLQDTVTADSVRDENDLKSEGHRSSPDRPAQQSSTPSDDYSGIISATFQMILVSLLLFWLPLGGSAIAGYVGGKNAGSVAKGILAAILPGIILAALIFASASTLAGLPVIGALLATGVIVMVVVYSLPLIAGAVIGGLLA